LQDQDLLDRRLSFARRRTKYQQGSQQRSLQSAIFAAIRTRFVCLAHGALRSCRVSGAAGNR
jgi:hypothetical protein